MIAYDYFKERNRIIDQAISDVERYCRTLDSRLEFKRRVEFHKHGNVQLGSLYYNKDSIFITIQENGNSNKPKDIKKKIKSWYEKKAEFDSQPLDDKLKKAMTPIINKWFNWPSSRKWGKDLSIYSYIDTDTGKLVYLYESSRELVNKPNVAPLIEFNYHPPTDGRINRRITDPREKKHDSLVASHNEIRILSDDVVRLMNGSLGVFNGIFTEYFNKGESYWNNPVVKCFYNPADDTMFAAKLDGTMVPFNFDSIPEFEKKLRSAMKRNSVTKD